MSRDTEKALQAAVDFLEEHSEGSESEEELNVLLNQFMSQYNSIPHKKVTPKNASTAEDFMELAQNASNKKTARKYAKKAVEADPEDLDAQLLFIQMDCDSMEEMIERLQALIEKCDQKYEEDGTFRDSMGHFYGMVWTRPYMRLHRTLLDIYQTTGMYGLGIEECKRIMELNENDNMGVRFVYMALLAVMEREEEARNFVDTREYEETMILLPMSVLYYKKNKLDEAKEFLKRTAKVNPDTKKFFRALSNGDLEKYTDEMEEYGYRPFTIQELITEMYENPMLFTNAPGFVEWAYHELK